MAGTRWVRLDTGYFRNPKTLVAGSPGRLLHLASICWVGDQLTDGVIPAEAVSTILREAAVKPKAIEAVVEAGLWIPNGHDSFVLHDYVTMNGKRADVEHSRDLWRERQRRYRERKTDERDG